MVEGVNSEPAQVPGLVATAGNGEVGLVWAFPQDGGERVTNFIVQWRQEDRCVFVLCSRA